MNNWVLIPLIGSPETFQIGLTGINYLMTVKWNDSPDGGWEFDLALSDTAILLVAGVPLITGADCLAGLEYLGIGGKIFVYTDGDSTLVPTFTNLGTESNLYFVTVS
jgi:hypothetical protein